MIGRTIQPLLEKAMFTGKIIVLYGARQVGKTTLSQYVTSLYDSISVMYLSGDDITMRSYLSSQSIEKIKLFLGEKKKIVVIDEAQMIPNIAIGLKLIHDHMPWIQVVATGSSSFDIAQQIHEPLTGRIRIFHLYPISIQEYVQTYSMADAIQHLEHFLQYGMYPETLLLTSREEKIQHVKHISTSYIFKDIFMLENIRNHESIQKLVQLLALQIGQEVSYNEIAKQIGLSMMTVRKYISLLESAFVVFQLGAYSNNPRKEVVKTKKIYFWDVGIRNALIDDFRPIDMRSDVGNLWENFVLSERKKYVSNNTIDVQSYFWRNYTQQEVDYIEVEQQNIRAYEIKRKQKKKFVLPSAFTSMYPGVEAVCIDTDSFWKYIV